MKAITVKVLAPTDTKGTRYKAFDSDGNSVTIKDSESPFSEQYAKYQLAAIRLCEKMDWHGVIEGGYTKEGMVFVFQDGRPYKV